MDKYDELLKSLENFKDSANKGDHSVLKQTAEALETLQSVVDEKQRLLDRALNDLAKDCDCKYCANIDQCSINRIERNLAYGGCAKWQWRGAKAEEKAS